jgi:hypothetical protein
VCGLQSRIGRGSDGIEGDDAKRIVARRHELRGERWDSWNCAALMIFCDFYFYFSDDGTEC